MASLLPGSNGLHQPTVTCCVGSLISPHSLTVLTEAETEILCHPNFSSLAATLWAQQSAWDPSKRELGLF